MIELTGQVVDVDHERCLLAVMVNGRGIVKLPVLRGHLAEFADVKNADVTVRVERKVEGQ